MSGTIDDKTLKCIRCGFCLSACPTFRLTGNEADSPRGRIYIMKSVLDGEIPIDDGVLQHLDSCLGCRACETACPSGVEYGSLIEQFRTKIEESGIRPTSQSFARKQMINVMTSPSAMKLAVTGASVMTKLTGKVGELPQFAADLITGTPGTHVKMPSIPSDLVSSKLKTFYPAEGERRYRVGILAGCVMRVMFNATNLATIRVLQKNGCDVVIPESAGCCGALHLHSGFENEAKERAKALLHSLNNSDFDAFIVNSAGCGSTLKEYGDLFAEDPGYRDIAMKLASKVKDVSEFLMEIGISVPEGRFNETVAYHDACHLAHGQRITSEPRRLLASIDGLKLVELPESDTCCGSAGTYSLFQPEMAVRLQQRKIDFIETTGANVVATGNPGCLAWIEQGCKERGLNVRIMHPIDILDQAYNG